MALPEVFGMGLFFPVGAKLRPRIGPLNQSGRSSPAKYIPRQRRLSAMRMNKSMLR